MCFSDWINYNGIVSHICRILIRVCNLILCSVILWWISIWTNKKTQGSYIKNAVKGVLVFSARFLQWQTERFLNRHIHFGTLCTLKGIWLLKKKKKNPFYAKVVQEWDWISFFYNLSEIYCIEFSGRPAAVKNIAEQ